jgi:hypothetical protein
VEGTAVAPPTARLAMEAAGVAVAEVEVIRLAVVVVVAVIRVVAEVVEAGILVAAEVAVTGRVSGGVASNAARSVSKLL